LYKYTRSWYRSSNARRPMPCEDTQKHATDVTIFARWAVMMYLDTRH